MAVFWGVPLTLIAGHGAIVDAERAWLIANIKLAFADEWAGVRLVLTGFAIALAYLASIAIHEFGHLAAGWAMDFRYEQMQIGRIHIDQSFHFSRRAPSDDERLGEVCFSPEGMKNKPWRYAVMTVAGPLANLLVATVLLVLPFHKSLVSGSFIVVCLYLGVFNLLPLASDGRRLFLILFRRRDHEAEIALALLYREIAAGKTYDELSPQLIAETATLQNKSVLTVLAQTLTYAAAYNNRDYEAAAKSLESAFSSLAWAPSLKKNLIYGAAVLQAKRGRIDLAEAWSAEYPAQACPRCHGQIQGAILEARGDFSGALAKIAECEKILSDEPDSKSKSLSFKELKKWKLEIEQKSAAVSS
jgi:hypothetical protein